MIQTIKTTIRWRDADGQIVGAYRENTIDLPKWGKKKYMREEINALIEQMAADKTQIISAPKSFTEFVTAAFDIDSICTIKSRTDGSYIHLKGEPLKQYIDSYKELSCNA